MDKVDAEVVTKRNRRPANPIKGNYMEITLKD